MQMDKQLPEKAKKCCRKKAKKVARKSQSCRKKPKRVAEKVKKEQKELPLKEKIPTEIEKRIRGRSQSLTKEREKNIQTRIEGYKLVKICR